MASGGNYHTPNTTLNSVITGFGGTTTSNTGGSQSHNNMQPYTVVNYIIATGKDTGVSVSDIVMGA
jgi:microcystin-dependent protein